MRKSFSMGLKMRAELRQMAAEILSELNGDEEPEIGAGKDFINKPSDRHMQKKYGYPDAEERLSYFEQAQLNPKGEEKKEGTDEMPSTKFRNAFLDRCELSTLIVGDYPNNNLDFSRGTPVKLTAGELAFSASGKLPQELSDYYCRDSRRYDGVFERY